MASKTRGVMTRSQSTAAEQSESTRSDSTRMAIHLERGGTPLEDDVEDDESDDLRHQWQQDLSRREAERNQWQRATEMELRTLSEQTSHIQETVEALTEQFKALIESIKGNGNNGKQRESRIDGAIATPHQPQPQPQPAASTSQATHIRESELVKELIRLIPRYDGTGGAQKLNDYTSNFENYATRSQESNPDKLALATAKLCGDASMWWIEHCATEPGTSADRIKTWEALKAKLKETYAPPEQADVIRDKLWSLRQRGTIAEYTTEFRKLKMQLTDLGDADARHLYLHGLKPQVQSLARSQKENLTDLRTLQNACLRLENGTSSAPQGNEAHAANSEARGRFKNPRGNYGKAHGNNSGGGNNNQATSGKPSVTKTCPLCKAPGHYAEKCRKLKEFQDSYDKVNAITKTTQTNYASATTIIDSGATQHMFADRNAFQTLSRKEATITCANSQSIRATHIGKVKFGANKALDDVLYVPDLQHNLISVSALTKEGNDVTFKSDGTVTITTQDEAEPIKIGHAVGNLYQATNSQPYLASAIRDEYTLWHHRLGHPSRNVLLSMPNHVIGLEQATLKPPDGKCSACLRAKASRMPFGNATSRATTKLERVHSDLCGPMPVTSINGAKYVLTFIDDFTRHATIYFLANKSETFEKFLKFKASVERQSGQLIKILRSDGGGEFTSHEFRDYLATNGIRHETTVAETPEQNGVAERYNRTLIEAIRSLMLAGNIPGNLWAELGATAAYLRNRTPTRANSGKTPHEVWHGNKPNIKHLRIIWSDAYAYIPKAKRSKLDPKANQLKLIGYHVDKKAYRLWNPIKERIQFSRDVTFDEATAINQSHNPINDDEEEYVIEAIIGERHIDGVTQYLVKWQGYPNEENTWEPLSNLSETAAFHQWINRPEANAAASCSH